MTDDAELLRRYVQSASEAAFAELVQRYIGLVYHAARRQVGGDAAAAEDVTQAVFSLLARKAASLLRHESLAGWLHATARFAALQTLRAERRRRSREQEAHDMQELSSDARTAAAWERLRPVIDQALGELSESDREAVLLRYFAGLPLAQIGEKFKVTENTARMRVDRALAKLQAVLMRRGVTSTAAILDAVLVGEASGATPVGLAATVTGTALASKGAAMTSLAFMSMFKFSTGIVAVAATAGLVGLVLQYQANVQLRDDVASLQQKAAELTEVRAEKERLAKSQADSEFQVAALRAENLQLQAQAAAASKSPGAINAAGVSPADARREAPALPEGFQINSLLDGRYTGLIKALNLTPDQWDRIRTLLLAKQQAASAAVEAALKQGMNARRNLPAIREVVAAAQAPVDDQIRAALGEAGYAQFQQYEQMLPQHNTVNDLAQMLRDSPTPLSDDQARQMVEILAQTEEPQGKGGIGRLLNGNLSTHSKITAATIVRSAGLLSDAQVEALKKLQQLQLGVTIDASASPESP